MPRLAFDPDFGPSIFFDVVRYRWLCFDKLDVISMERAADANERKKKE